MWRRAWPELKRSRRRARSPNLSCANPSQALGQFNRCDSVTSMEHLELNANGMTFRAVTTGSTQGRPVLFLHGFPQTSDSWRYQLASVAAAGYRGVAFDQRGYSPGARPHSIDDYRTDALVGDVLAVAEKLGMDRFDLVGHDWGAMVAWVLAGMHPERLYTLTAVSVPHPRAFAAALSGHTSTGRVGSGENTESEQADDQRRRSSYIDVFRAEGGVAERILLGEDGSGAGLRAMFERTGLTSDNEQVTRYVDAMVEPGAMTAALNWYRATDPGLLAAVGPIAVPTLYVWSTEDAALGRTGAEGTVEWVTGPYRFEVLEGVSHWIPETAPDALTRLLLDHLAIDHAS